MPPARGRGTARKHRQPRRTHNLGGCSTCRRRHVKCDRTRPECTTCHNSGLACEGFPSQIRWASVSSHPPAKVVQRHGITSQPLSAAADDEPNGCSNGDLAKLGTNVSANHAVHEAVSFLEDLLPESGDSNHVMVDPPPAVGMIEDSTEFDPIDPDILNHPSASSFSDFESLFDTSSGLVWNDLFDSTFSISVPMIQHQLDRGPLNLFSQSFNQSQDSLSVSHIHDYASVQSKPYSREDRVFIADALDLRLPPHNPQEMDEEEVLEHAKTLLKHFRDVVVPQFSPVPMDAKSPWEVNMWSAAVRTHADITYLESHDVKHANKANFFAILGCSAHNITKTLLSVDTISPEKGTQILNFVSRKAKKHMQESLKLETSGLQKAKYKDQLMAIISLIALATLSGNPADARCHLIDAERLLRLRGLAKQQVSRRARLLHHVYTWLRIIGESTFILHDHDSSGFQARIEKTFMGSHEVFNSSTANEKDNTTGTEHPQLDDFLRIKSNGGDQGYDVETTEDQDIGLRDIHLEDLRPNPKSLYMDIYGIPETWLSLVSQTTRVANIVDYLESTSIQAPQVFVRSLQKKTAQLEHMICSFSARHSNSRSVSPLRGSLSQVDTAPPQPPKPCRPMIRALGSALVILFYRRIRKVHPLILQGHVNDVIAALKDFDLTQGTDDSKTLGTPWPAFIAGCEAMSLSSRDWLMDWMRRGARLSAFNGFTSSQQVMQEVWEHRDASDKGSKPDGAKRIDYDGGGVYSWVDVLQEGRFWLMLY